MKAAIKYLGLFVILFFAIDLSVGWIMDSLFPGITYGTYGKVNKSLKAGEEVLIFGSSRAEHHYDPDLITRATGKSCYNTGLGGYGLFYNYALLDEIVSKHKPEVVILDLSPNVIVDPMTYMKLNIFTPYYFDYASFAEILALDPEFSVFKTYFKTYVYNSTMYDLVRGKVSNKEQGNGYKAIYHSLDTDAYVPMRLSAEEALDPTKIDYLRKFMEVAGKQNIKLICFVSPTYEKFDMDNRIISELRNLADEMDVEFHDFSDFDEVYRHPEYFKDQLHLNADGVEIFNREVSRIINQ